MAVASNEVEAGLSHIHGKLQVLCYQPQTQTEPCLGSKLQKLW